MAEEESKRKLVLKEKRKSRKKSDENEKSSKVTISKQISREINSKPEVRCSGSLCEFVSEYSVERKLMDIGYIVTDKIVEKDEETNELKVSL